MSPTSSIITKTELQGIAAGVLFMAFFGTLWAGIGIRGLQGWGEPGLSITVLLVGLGLLIGGIALLISSRHISNQGAETDSRRERRTGIWFGIIFAAEGLLIGAASAICSAISRFDLFFPIMAIIVGVHFLPLAALFQIRAYYLVGTLLCALALITLIAVPERATLGGQPIMAQSVVLGFGAALILWGVGLGLWLLGKRLLTVAVPTAAQRA
ncbi:MAG: hypothetical protein ABIV47_10290 [Roseiflexaceae bacterium]